MRDIEHDIGVAVRWRLGYGLHRDQTGGSGPIVDHDGLPPRLVQLLPDQPRGKVGPATRRDPNEQTNWFRWIACGRRRNLSCRNIRGTDGQSQETGGYCGASHSEATQTVSPY